MEHFISMYIDNELSLDEKILFLNQIHNSELYKNDAVSLLRQEQILITALAKKAPDIEIKKSRSKTIPFINRSLSLAVAACLLVLFTFLVKQNFTPQTQTSYSVEPETTLHRFVIHQRESNLVEITGSFTNWQRLPLSPAGTNGYWEISLKLPAGEHRYAFILDGSNYLPDPTVATRESDDFGATNSILKVEV